MKNLLIFLLIFVSFFAFAQSNQNSYDNNGTSEEYSATTEFVNKPRIWEKDGVTYVPKEAKIVLTPEENESGVYQIVYALNSLSKQLYNGPFHLTEEGRNVITYDIVDNVENTSNTKVDTFYLDTVAPELSLAVNGVSIVKNERIYLAKDATVELKAKDITSGLDKIYYSTDGENYVEYTGAFTINTDGEYRISAFAYDNVGNVSDEHIRLVVADTSAPSVKLVASEKARVIEGTNYFSPNNIWTAKIKDDGVGLKGVYVSVDDADYIIYDKYIKVTENGEHSIKVFAVDQLDNKTEELEYNFYVDSINPDVKLDVEF